MNHLAQQLLDHLFSLAMLSILVVSVLLCIPALADPLGGVAAPDPGVIGVIFGFLVKVAPLLAALGVFHLGAAALRTAWAKVQIAAGNTPTKIDDFLVHLMDPAVAEVIRLVDAGDVDAAKKKLDGLRALVPKGK